MNQLLNMVICSALSINGEHADSPGAPEPAPVVMDLSEVLADPLKYDGMKFLGLVFVHPPQYLLYPTHHPSISVEDYKRVVILPGKNAERLTDLPIKSGDELLLAGRIAVDNRCFAEPGSCSPYAYPVYLDDVAVVTIQQVDIREELGKR